MLGGEDVPEANDEGVEDAQFKVISDENKKDAEETDGKNRMGNQN